MELDTKSPGGAAWTLGRDADGRERAVVVFKRALRLRGAGGAAFAEPAPRLVYADEFEGEPGLSAPIREYDFAPVKHACDVLVEGPAVAPGGEPIRELTVGVKVGRVKKAFTVKGPRVWREGGAQMRVSPPEPFVEASISYGAAFGGVDRSSDDEVDHIAFTPNPVGRGFAPRTPMARLDGEPMPNTEEAGVPIVSPRERYRPMALGPIGRAWPPRIDYAGTYDEHWLEHDFPFLPKDFDERYFQAAPLDQQTDHLRGGETVTLLGLTPDGRCEFTLPDLSLPISFFKKGGERIDKEMVCDTLVIIPKEEKIVVTQRASVPIKRDVFELTEAVIGRRSRAWERARALGKTYRPGLGALAAANVLSRDEDG